MGIWKNAFKLPKPEPVNDEDRKLLARLALKVKKRSLGNVSALVMESSRPVHNLSAEFLTFLMPLITVIFGRKEAERVIKILRNPEAVSYFINQLNGEENGK